MDQDATRESAEQLARQVEAHPDFRVVRRLDPARFVAPLAGPAVRRGVTSSTPRPPAWTLRLIRSSSSG